jgi:hypothetical protein
MFFFTGLNFFDTSANNTLGCTSLYATSAGNVTKPQEKKLSGSVAVICETSQYTCTRQCNIDYTNQSTISTRQDTSADSVSFWIEQAG